MVVVGGALLGHNELVDIYSTVAALGTSIHLGTRAKAGNQQHLGSLSYLVSSIVL